MFIMLLLVLNPEFITTQPMKIERVYIKASDIVSIKEPASTFKDHKGNEVDICVVSYGKNVDAIINESCEHVANKTR